MKCFYHKSDLDGVCSGALVQYEHPECEMIGIDYDRQNDFTVLNGIKPDETVFVVDFSFSEGIFESMLSRGMNVIWIDHHKSAIEKLQNMKLRGLRRIGTAACELVWEWFYGAATKPPLAVKLLGRYDVWDHRDDRVMPFQWGMRNLDSYYPDHSLWPDLFKDNEQVKDILISGNVILDYEQRQSAKIAKGMAFECNFHGLRAIAMNRPYANSKAFDSVYDPERHDIMILFGMKPGSCKYSLYCNKESIDVSEIAKQYGGGGHKGAAGFFVNQPLVLEVAQ